MDRSLIDDSNGCLGKKLAPFNPSGDKVIEMAIEMLQMDEGSILYDLGCGDGRLLVEAVKATGARAVGVDYDKRFADRALRRVADEKLSSKIRIIHGNLFDVDPADATAIFLYLVPEGMAAVKDTVVSLLRTGTRAVTYVFSLQGLKPARVESFKATKLYLYTADSLGPSTAP